MIPVLIVLYALSAVLPIVGITRLAVLAHGEAAPVRAAPTLPDGTNGSRGQVNAAATALVNLILDRPGAVLRDLGWIGGGLIAGAVAGVWSLFI